MQCFRISAKTFDIAGVRQQLLAHEAGAYASFEGWVRDSNDGRSVIALTYESYLALAETEGAKVIDEAKARFAIIEAACVHRVGRLELGELAV